MLLSCRYRPACRSFLLGGELTFCQQVAGGRPQGRRIFVKVCLSAIACPFCVEPCRPESGCALSLITVARSCPAVDVKCHNVDQPRLCGRTTSVGLAPSQAADRVVYGEIGAPKSCDTWTARRPQGLLDLWPGRDPSCANSACNSSRRRSVWSRGSVGRSNST